MRLPRGGLATEPGPAVWARWNPSPGAEAGAAPAPLGPAPACWADGGRIDATCTRCGLDGSRPSPPEPAAGTTGVGAAASLEAPQPIATAREEYALEGESWCAGTIRRLRSLDEAGHSEAAHCSPRLRDSGMHRRVDSASSFAHQPMKQHTEQQQGAAASDCELETRGQRLNNKAASLRAATFLPVSCPTKHHNPYLTPYSDRAANNQSVNVDVMVVCQTLSEKGLKIGSSRPAEAAALQFAPFQPGERSREAVAAGDEGPRMALSRSRNLASASAADAGPSDALNCAVDSSTAF